MLLFVGVVVLGFARLSCVLGFARVKFGIEGELNPESRVSPELFPEGV